METNFLGNFLSNPFSALDLNYEKPEVKKNICNSFNIKNQLNGTCPLKTIENGHLNGHMNGTVNGHTNGTVNGHTNGIVNGHTNGYVKNEHTTNGVCPMKSVENGHLNEKINGYLNETMNGHKDETNENDKKNKPLDYGDYLKLDQLLSCQLPITRQLNRKGGEAHDEHLFIVIHQSYELWFKQVLYELDSIRNLITKKLASNNECNFTGDYVFTIHSRLNRIIVILKLLVKQWEVMETMSPLNFNEFRNDLRPASGFQSHQFRLMENKLGVRYDERANYGKCNYVKVFKDKNKVNSIMNSQNEPSLFDLVERWLEKGCVDTFIAKYSKAINKVINDLEIEMNNETDAEKRKQKEEEYKKVKQRFEEITNEERYNVLLERKDRRLSYKAFKSTLCILMNSHDSKYSQMFQIINDLQDIDKQLHNWREKHMYIVLKMIGQDNMGTGGSTGYQYLKQTTFDCYKVFNDFIKISGYITSPNNL